MTKQRMVAVLWMFVFTGVNFADEIVPGQKTDRPAVKVATPIERMVTDYRDFTGRLAPASQVDLRARVSGYLMHAPFKDGAEVKKGDLLFEIDPRPYQAQLEKAVSVLALDRASLELAKANRERDKAAEAAAPGTISKQQLDHDVAAINEAEAKIRMSAAEVELCKVNLQFTRITSPIDGSIGRRRLDLGNLVVADKVTLATVVSTDHMYVYFDLDELTFLQLRRLENNSKAKERVPVPIQLALADEADFSRQSSVDLVESRVDPQTGTIRLRASVLNPKTADRLLVPGLFVRIRMQLGQPHKTLLVTERAVSVEQGMQFVYVIDAENKVQMRKVDLGPLQSDGLRAINNGLRQGILVIVSEVKNLRPGMSVQPEKIEMPVLATPAKTAEKE